MRSVALLVLVVMAACRGEQGPPGPQGQAGEVGPPGPKGDRGDPAPAVKTLHLIDQNGVDLGRVTNGGCYWHDGVQGEVCPLRLGKTFYFLQYDCQGPAYTYVQSIANSYFIYRGMISTTGTPSPDQQTFPSNLGFSGCQSGLITKGTGLAPVVSMNIQAAVYESGDLTFDMR